MKIVMSVLLALFTLSSQAGVYMYTFVPKKLPAPPRGYPPHQYPAGYFLVKDTAVESGIVTGADVIVCSVHYPMILGGYIYNSVDLNPPVTIPCMIVDPLSGAILAGGVRAISTYGLYGHFADFSSSGIIQENYLGGSSIGTWTVTYTP